MLLPRCIVHVFIFTHARHLTRFDDPAASLYTRPTKLGPHCRRQHLHDPQRRSCGLAQSRTVRLPISTPFHRSIGLACTCVISLERTPHTMHCYVALTVQHHEAQYDVQHAIRFGQPAEHAVWVDGAEQHRTSGWELPNAL